MLSSRRARSASGCAVAAPLRSKQRPRPARAEAARAGRWWPWLNSNGVTLFVQQYDRGTWQQRQQYELLLYEHLVPGMST